MGQATSLDSARKLWHQFNNTAAFNFLVGSASDAAAAGGGGGEGESGGPAAVALETIAGFSGEFMGGSAIEAAATFSCVNGTVMDGTKCSWPDNSGASVSIGSPLPTAVWRSNHGMHPRVMRTQEPLWNDTVMRYYLIHDTIVETAASAPGGRMTLAGALNITSLLGQKGADYGSCDPANFKTGDASNILSVVYDASNAVALAAWEDGTKETWSPAACNTYLSIDFSKWWGGLRFD